MPAHHQREIHAHIKLPVPHCFEQESTAVFVDDEDHNERDVQERGGQNRYLLFVLHAVKRIRRIAWKIRDEVQLRQQRNLPHPVESVCHALVGDQRTQQPFPQRPQHGQCHQAA